MDLPQEPVDMMLAREIRRRAEPDDTAAIQNRRRNPGASCPFDLLLNAHLQGIKGRIIPARPIRHDAEADNAETWWGHQLEPWIGLDLRGKVFGQPDLPIDRLLVAASAILPQ